MTTTLIKEIDNARVVSKNASVDTKFEGTLAEAVRFIERNQICEVGLWQKFAEVFKQQEDFANDVWHTSWRSEFWGKMMRGASMVIAYTKDENMYKILEASVRDMLSAQEPS